jgi:hypothetical protein
MIICLRVFVFVVAFLTMRKNFPRYNYQNISFVLGF